MNVEALDLWRRRLEWAARPVLEGTPIVDGSTDASHARSFIEAFTDERGHRRPVDLPFLAAILAVDPFALAAGVWGPGGRDVELWWLVADGVSSGRWRTPAWMTRGRAPITGAWTDGPIEVWTERELSGLHATWSIARGPGADPGLQDRCLDAALWLMENVQPDNATGHPWAAHVFAWMWAKHGDEEARLYAETLLHNAIAGRGRPDRFSACVLWHAAAGLERQAG
ncbi:MAG: hypothetical protein KF787_02785 [Phycisphaeraceae bacterium]|nr:hypothetical protein [Phycisphaerae bacterium]MBX3391553.1 hypothetical protein [Phycisphaeraceae bacterium]